MCKHRFSNTSRPGIIDVYNLDRHDCAARGDTLELLSSVFCSSLKFSEFGAARACIEILSILVTKILLVDCDFSFTGGKERCCPLLSSSVCPERSHTLATTYMWLLTFKCKMN